MIQTKEDLKRYLDADQETAVVDGRFACESDFPYFEADIPEDGNFTFGRQGLM